MLFTQTRPAIRPRTQISIEAELREQGVPMFGTQLHERDPYRAIFSFGGTLAGLDRKQVRGIETAQFDARRFSNEVISRVDALAAPLKGVRKRAKVA